MGRVASGDLCQAPSLCVASPGCSRHPGLPTVEGSLQGRPQVDSWHCGGWVCHFVGQQAPSSMPCPLVQQNSKRQMQGGGGRHLLLSLTPDPAYGPLPSPLFYPPLCAGPSKETLLWASVPSGKGFPPLQQELKTQHPNRPFLNIARPPPHPIRVGLVRISFLRPPRPRLRRGPKSSSAEMG